MSFTNTNSIFGGPVRVAPPVVATPHANSDALAFVETDIPVPTPAHFPFRLQWCLFMLRMSLVLIALWISATLMSAARYAVFEWHLKHIQHHCEFLNGTAASGPSPFRLPAGIGGEHGTDLVYTLTIMLALHATLVAVSAPVACMLPMQTRYTGSTLCCCIGASPATAIVLHYYHESTMRGILGTSTLLLGVAIGVSILQCAAMRDDASWEIPPCAAAIHTDNLHWGRSVFWVVPCSLILALCIDFFLILTTNRRKHHPTFDGRDVEMTYRQSDYLRRAVR